MEANRAARTRSSDLGSGSQGALGCPCLFLGGMQPATSRSTAALASLADLDSSRTSSRPLAPPAGLSTFTDRASGAISSIPSPFSTTGIEGKTGGEVLSGEDGSSPRGGARRVDGAGKWWDDEVRPEPRHLLHEYTLTASLACRTATRPSALLCVSSRRSSCVSPPRPPRPSSCRADLSRAPQPFVALCIFISQAAFQSKWGVGTSGRVGVSLFFSVEALLHGGLVRASPSLPTLL